MLLHEFFSILKSKINREQQLKLTAPVTRKKVEFALQGINNLKAPGRDGINAVFFKKAWPVMGDEIVNVVLDFFDTGEMYKAINCKCNPHSEGAESNQNQ